jgi:hypothetical protein
MNHYSFEQPFVDELVEDLRIGLLQEFDRLDRIGACTSAYTNHVKSTLAERCRDHFNNGDFFAFTSNTFGEYLLDFSYGSYPPAFNTKMPVKKGVGYRLFVACESEWGIEGNHEGTYTMVLDDFCKLLDVRAQVKVMVFGYDEAGLEALRSGFEALLDSRKAELAGETWFFLGVPWDSEHRVSGKLVFSALAPEAVRLDFAVEKEPG